MRNLSVFCFVILFSCACSKKLASSQNEKNTVVYIFPSNVSKLLSEQMRNDSATYYLQLVKEDTFYLVFLHQIDAGEENPWVRKSNRKGFLGDRLVPIIFDHDGTFAITDDASEFLKKIRSEDDPYLHKRIWLHHGSFYIKFKKSTGEIFESGIDGHSNK